MPSARMSAGGANSPRPYATTYATPEILEATWEAVSPGATGGAIEIRPYPTAAPRAGGGFAMPAPPVNPLDGFDDLNGTRFVNTSGQVQWMPTREEIAAARRHGLPIEGIDYGRLDGMDGSYAGRPVRTNPTASIGRAAASSSLDDVIRGVGGVGGLATGGLLAGGIAGYAEYQSGGGVASAVAVGAGAGVGSAVGTVVGGIAGSALGPVGTVVGGMIGGAIGSALGGAIGDALIPDANLNNALEVEGREASAPLNLSGLTDFVGGARIKYAPNPSFPDYFLTEDVLRIRIYPQGAMLSYSPAIERFVCGSGGSAGIGAIVLDSLQILGTGVCVGQFIPYSPAIEPVPYNPNARDRPATGTPDFRLPGVDLPRPRPTPTFGNPRLRDPSPFGEPSPEPNPDPTDDPYPYPYPWPRPTPTPGPTPDPAPYPDPTDDPNPNPNPNPDDDDQENCNPCAKLDQVLELLQPAIAGQIDLSPCPVDDGEPVEDVRTIEGAGLVGISEKLGLTLQGLDALWELLRCQDEDQRAFPIPDSWELKKELNCPQLIIVCKKPGDKSSYRRSFSIPHPNSNVSTEEGAKRIFTYRRTYNRGSHLTQLVLKDNSKIKLTTDSRTAGQDLMDWLVGKCLDLNYQDSPPGEYRHGENTGWDIIPATVEFYTVAYYSQGKKSNVPDWIFTIPE